MSRACALLAICVTSVGGQDFAQLNQAVQKQLDENAKSVGIGSGELKRLRLSLRPQTIGSDAIFVATDSPSVRVQLRLPNGTSVNESNAKAAGFEWKVAPTLDGFQVGACKLARNWITVGLPPNQPVGDYIVEVEAPSDAQPLTACASFLSIGLGREGSDYETVGGSVTTDRQFYQLGDPVTIAVPVLEGTQAIRNAHVEAIVSYQDNVVVKDEVLRILLTDKSGTGIYSGVFRPERASEYSCRCDDLRTKAPGGRKLLSGPATWAAGICNPRQPD